MERGKCVCLVSDANKDTFPNNTVTRYSNNFPQPLIDRQDRRFCLRLRYVAVNKLLSIQAAEIGRITVHISEIEPQIEGQKLTYRVGAFPIIKETAAAVRSPHYNRSVYYEHTFREAPQLPIKFQDLRQLRVLLTDENGIELKYEGGEGLPTIIMLDVEEEDPESRGQFTVTCRSNGEGLHYRNELAYFYSPMPTLHTLQDYEVALQSIVYPAKLTEDQGLNTITIDGETFDYTDKKFESNAEFLTALKEDVKNDERLKTELIIHEEDNQVVIARNLTRRREHRGQRRKRFIVITCSDNFLKVIAGPQGNKIDDLAVLIPGARLEFGGEPDVHRLRPSQVGMLQCDILTPNILSGQRAKLLQVVPIYHETAAEKLYEPRELIFQPVEAMPFSQILFSFTHPNGEPKHFVCRDNKNAMIVITLIFRKRK